MKWLILLGLLFVLCTFVAVRYRPQIQTAIQIWKLFRKMRQAHAKPEKQITRQENSSNVSLVKCSKCGTWIPLRKALNLRSKTFYCSANCMESAVRIG